MPPNQERYNMAKKSVVNTTDNVGEKPSTVKKPVKQSDEQKMYESYVNGKNISSIAVEFNVAESAVFNVINAVDRKEK